jgi:hypothetical protein
MGSFHLVSLMPLLIDGAGHGVTYNQSVERAAQQLGWNFSAEVPAFVSSSSVPSHWRRRLAVSRSIGNESGWLAKALNFMGLVRCFRSIFGAYRRNRGGPIILFMEAFSLAHLMAFVCALAATDRRDFYVGLLLRYSPMQLGGRAYLFGFGIRVLALLFGQRLRLMADSDLLQQAQQPFFKLSVAVLPIPHTAFDPICQDQPSAMPRMLRWWWPGPARVQKGSRIIQSLLDLDRPQGTDIFLTAVESAGFKAHSSGIQLKTTGDVLTREAYDGYMAASDGVLLPYDAIVYGQATSGIFVETVCAGKVPFVTRGTWMAYELSKFGLTDLVMDWSDDQILSQIVARFSDGALRERLGYMREHYVKFHCLSCFAERLQDCFR